MRPAVLAFGTVALAVAAHGAAAQTEATGAAWVKTAQSSADLALAGLDLVSSSVIPGQKFSLLVTFWRDNEARDFAGDALQIRTFRCFDLLDQEYTHAHCEVADRDD